MNTKPRAYILAILACAGATSLHAAQFTWTGGGADNYWSTGGNWQGASSPPDDNTAVVALSGNIRNQISVDGNKQIQQITVTS